MPVCFQLSRRDSEVFTPVPFQHIDNELCQALDLPWDADKYVNSWYDHIGLRLALGYSWDKIIDYYREGVEDGPYHEWSVRSWRIAAYLAEHYQSDSWWEAKN